MAEHLALEVATPTGLALKTEAEFVQAPSVNGEFGVFPGHLPLLASLKCGVLTYKADGKVKVAAVGPGFVEAGATKVLLLTDLFALPADIDADAVRKELASAEEAHKKALSTPDRSDDDEAQRQVDWANARLEAKAQADR